MQTINNRMTETQIADLFSLAVQLQVKAEESDDRDTAILAYSIQSACSNLTESQREFRAADATIHNLELKLTDMAVQLANAESKCSELATELSAVDKIHNEAVFITDDHYEQCPPEVQKMIRSLAVLQIPACDTFLAEVRSQGVGAAIEHLSKKFEGTGHIGVPVMALEWLAQEIRKGGSPMKALNKQARQVQRYTNYGVDMMEWADGGYVRHSDYLALLDELEAKDAQIANLTAERDALREGAMGDAKHSNTRAAADIYFQLVEECEIPAGGSLVEYVSELRERAAADKGAAS